MREHRSYLIPRIVMLTVCAVLSCLLLLNLAGARIQYPADHAPLQARAVTSTLNNGALTLDLHNLVPDLSRVTVAASAFYNYNPSTGIVTGNGTAPFTLHYTYGTHAGSAPVRMAVRVE